MANLGMTPYPKQVIYDSPSQYPTAQMPQQQNSPQFMMANQQRANTSYAQNPYIGQQAPGVPTTQYAQGNNQQNPYMGQTTQQAQTSSNPYAGSNPYLQGQIDQAQGDATRGFETSVMPQLDRMAQQSGSFGNTGVQQMQGQAMSDHGKNLGNIAQGMRFNDYAMQAQLGESAANRNTANSQFNSGLNAGDLNRNMSGFLQGQGMDNTLGMFNAGQGNQMGQFGANLGFNNNALNANLMQSMGQFNAGQFNQGSQFNANQGNGMNMFNAGQGNQMWNNDANRYQQMDQFNQNMDFGVDNANWSRMRTGQQDQQNLIDKSLGWNQKGLDMATQIQNMPLEYQQLFMNMATQAGGLGGSNSQNLQGNPWLGALGGWQTGNAIFNQKP